MSDYFTNPYNFVPFEGECERKALEETDKGSHTGYFDCSMKLLTPLFIPNTTDDHALFPSSEKASEQDLESKDGKDKKGEFKSYTFYSYEDLSGGKGRRRNGIVEPPERPVIPGSEIRGAVRSVYEAAFNGCMSTVGEDTLLGRRWPMPKKPGILTKDKQGWVIHPCKRAMLYVDFKDRNYIYNSDKFGTKMSVEAYASLKEGDRLWIRLNEEEYPKKGKGLRGMHVVEKFIIPEPGDDCPEGMIEGWVHKGEWSKGSNKHHESVFYEERKEDNISEKRVNEEEIQLLQKALEEYRNEKKNTFLKKRNSGGGNWYPEYNLDKERILVYYCDDKRLPSFLSPACIGKEVFNKTIGTILQKNGNYNPCEERSGLCHACQLFGMTSKKTGKKDAVGSRVRFTDALTNLPKDKEYVTSWYEDRLVLPESGEPRPGAVEFYTCSPYKDYQKEKWDYEGYWTYDYICVKKEMNSKNATREMLDKDQPKLRGRKFYWHCKPDLAKMRIAERSGKMNQGIQPLKKSDEKKKERIFKFRVYFDRLNDDELARLRWSLDFCDGTCAHKIGRGKPFGFGSVQIHIDRLCFKKFDYMTGKWRETEVPEALSKLGNKPKKGKAAETLKLMASWDKRPDNVSYPILSSGKTDASYEWFTINRKGDKANKMQPAFIKLLPLPENECGVAKDNEKRLHK